jgi:hypothetical protein
MKTALYILLFFLALGQGCSPGRRLARLLEHHPELTVADTLRVRDTIAVPVVKTDSFIDLRQMTDTVVIEKERLSVKLFKQRDTLYVEGECKADTIIRERLIPVEKIRLVNPGLPALLFDKIPWLVLGLLGILLIIKIFNKYRH